MKSIGWKCSKTRLQKRFPHKQKKLCMGILNRYYWKKKTTTTKKYIYKQWIVHISKQRKKHRIKWNIIANFCNIIERYNCKYNWMINIEKMDRILP